MKSLLRFTLPCLVVLLLTGCGAKAFDLTQLALEQNGQRVEEFHLTAGIPADASLTLPDGAQADLSLADATVTVEREGENLRLLGEQKTETTLTLSLTGEGYETAQVHYPVTVALQQMAPLEMTLQAGQDEQGTKITQLTQLTLPFGETRSISVLADEGAVLTVDSGDTATAEAELNGNTLTVQAHRPGSTTLTLTARKPYCEDLITELPVLVEKASPQLTLAQKNVSAVIGQPVTVHFSAAADSQRTVTWDTAKLDVQESASSLTITPKTAGSSQVTIRAEGDLYTSETAVLTVNAAEPSVTLSALSPITVTAGEKKALTLSPSPADATLSATAGNDAVAVSLNGNQLTITGAYVGSGTVTIRVSAPGYTPAEQTLHVTVQAKQTALSHTDVAAEIIRRTNEERAAAGLPALVHDTALDAPAQLRAEEASRYWSHTRPDGSNFDTVYEEYGLTSPTYYGRGENLFAGNFLNAQLVVDGWMDSPGHKENILRPEYTNIGVAIVQGADGDYYYTQLFSHSK